VRAISGFTVDAYEPAPFDEHAEVPKGFQLSRTRIVKTFSGDLAGTSVTQAVMAVTQEGSAGYVAVELIVGSLQGRQGSFLLQHSATAARGAPSRVPSPSFPTPGPASSPGSPGRATWSSTPTGDTRSPSTTTCPAKREARAKQLCPETPLRSNGYGSSPDLASVLAF
jgi:hypothetical protein